MDKDGRTSGSLYGLVGFQGGPGPTYYTVADGNNNPAPYYVSKSFKCPQKHFCSLELF
jgi:hypothetical protein